MLSGLASDYPGEHAMCALEKDMYSAALGWNVLYVSVKFIWSNVSLQVGDTLLIFCLDELSNDVNGVLKFSTIIVLLSISPFLSVNIYVFRHSFVWCIYILNCYIFFLD